jgi:hypothetical protein
MSNYINLFSSVSITPSSQSAFYGAISRFLLFAFHWDPHSLHFCSSIIHPEFSDQKAPWQKFCFHPLYTSFYHGHPLWTRAFSKRVGRSLSGTDRQLSSGFCGYFILFKKFLKFAFLYSYFTDKILQRNSLRAISPESSAKLYCCCGVIMVLTVAVVALSVALPGK